MAWTTTKVSQFSPGGNCYCQIWSLSADTATVELNTGLAILDAAFAQPASFTSSVPNVQVNVLSAATASNGTVSITGCTNGDTMYLCVYGR